MPVLGSALAGRRWEITQIVFQDGREITAGKGVLLTLDHDPGAIGLPGHPAFSGIWNCLLGMVVSVKCSIGGGEDPERPVVALHYPCR